MGYTTTFNGYFKLDKPLTPEHASYLLAFSKTRRMQRDAKIAARFVDPVREAVGLPVGLDGGYVVAGGGAGFAGHRQLNDASVLEVNYPPGGQTHGRRPDGSLGQLERHPDSQPGLWCQWVPGRITENTNWWADIIYTNDLRNFEGCDCIAWDEEEKFYEYVPWLNYLIKHFLQPWGYTLNGRVIFRGEEEDDMGAIVVENNVVEQRFVDLWTI